MSRMQSTERVVRLKFEKLARRHAVLVLCYGAVTLPRARRNVLITRPNQRRARYRPRGLFRGRVACVTQMGYSLPKAP
ncbi:hypothetical protein ACVIW0_007885 [Bradyrhizobium sp. USDA 4454]